MPFVNTLWGRLAFTANGSGSAVVAIHGTASSSGQWKSFGEHIQAEHAVFAPDLPGHGASSVMTSATGNSLVDDADAINAFIEQWGEPVHLVGHSYGAAVALKATLNSPEMVASLTLIEPAIFQLLRNGSAADQGLFREICALAGCINAAAACGCAESGMAHFIDYWHGAGTWSRMKPAVRCRLTRMLPQTINHFATMDDASVTPGMLNKLNVPTLLLTGLESSPVTMRLTEHVADLLPDARLVMVPGVGHMLPVSDPHIVDPMIANHIRQIEAIAFAKPGIAA